MNDRLPYTDGPRDCAICFIGEAPGINEYRHPQKLPFIGRAGIDLTHMLSSAGINRVRCYLTNVIKERPPDTAKKNNDVTAFIDLGKRKYSGKETHLCGEPVPNEPHATTNSFLEYMKILKKELMGISANVFVPLGNTALYALTGLTGITKYRGSILESTLMPGRKVVPTIHPANVGYGEKGVSRPGHQRTKGGGNYLNRYFIIKDFIRALKESKSPDIVLPHRNLLIDPSYYEVIAYLNMMYKSDRVTFDVEVINKELSCISFASDSVTSMSIPFRQGSRDYYTPDQELTIMLMIAEILEDPKIIKQNQYIAFDLTFLYDKYGIKGTGVFEDSMIAQGVAYPDFPKDLGFIASVATREPYYKDDAKMWKDNTVQDIDFWLYSAKDSIIPHEAIPVIKKDLEIQGNLETYKRHCRLIEPIMFMYKRGIKVDIEGLAKAKKVAKEKEAELLTEFEVLCPGVNPNSPKQMIQEFYVRLGYKPFYNREGTITTDVNALKKLIRSGSKEATALMGLRKVRKMIGTYYEMTFDEDNRLRCSMNPIGTKTGRLSSRQTIYGTGGNLQNLPYDMREFLIADTDYIAYKIDLAQAENRIVAYIAPEPAMIKAFEDGVDVHSLTYALAFNIPLDKVSDEDGSSEFGDGTKSQRFWGKTCNHSLNYDFGAIQFSIKYEIPIKEAKAIINRYHSIYPGVRQQYHRWVQAQLSKNRTLINPYNRRRRFLDRWGDSLFKAAYAHVPQSTVADKINLQGLIPFYYDQDKYAAGELLNQVHDDIWFQIPLSAGWQAHASILMNIKESLETPIQWRATSFVVPAEVSMGLNFKNMEDLKGDAFTTIEGLAKRLKEIHTRL